MPADKCANSHMHPHDTQSMSLPERIRSPERAERMRCRTAEDGSAALGVPLFGKTGRGKAETGREEHAAL